MGHLTIPAFTSSCPGNLKCVVQFALDNNTLTIHYHATSDKDTLCPGYDHNYVIDGEVGPLRPVARAHASATGITMQAETTLPGVHFYTANYLPEGRIGKDGCAYAPRHGFCLETQFFPDAPNQPFSPLPS